MMTRNPSVLQTRPVLLAARQKSKNAPTLTPGPQPREECPGSGRQDADHVAWRVAPRFRMPGWEFRPPTTGLVCDPLRMPSKIAGLHDSRSYVETRAGPQHVSIPRDVVALATGADA